MGYHAADVDTGVSLLMFRSKSASQQQPASASQSTTAHVVDLLTTMDSLIDMGYARHVSVKAVAQVGTDIQAAVHFIKMNNLESP